MEVKSKSVLMHCTVCDQDTLVQVNLSWDCKTPQRPTKALRGLLAPLAAPCHKRKAGCPGEGLIKGLRMPNSSTPAVCDVNPAFLPPHLHKAATSVPSKIRMRQTLVFGAQYIPLNRPTTWTTWWKRHDGGGSPIPNHLMSVTDASRIRDN